MTTPNTDKNKKTKKNGKVLILALAMSGVLGTGLVGTSIATSDLSFAHSKHEGGKDHKRGKREKLTDAQIEERATRKSARISDKINATDVQEQKIKTLMLTFAKDVRPMRKLTRETRHDMRQLLLDDTIDVAKIENLRKERIAEIDRVTNKVTVAMIDVAQSLTVEQRKQLGELLDQRRKKRWRDR